MGMLQCVCVAIIAQGKEAVIFQGNKEGTGGVRERKREMMSTQYSYVTFSKINQNVKPLGSDWS